MKEAQRARWAKIRGEVEPTAPTAPEAAKPKRQISEEGMKRIVAATKKRWRLARAAKAQAAAKKAAPARKKAAPAKVAKKSAPARKAAVKKSASTSTPAVTEAAGQ
jgi:hypothetical protein